MADDLGERTEQPTAKRKGEARSRGQVAKSTDLSGAIDMSAGLVILAVMGGGVLASMAGVMRAVLEGRTPGDVLDPGSIGATIGFAARAAMGMALPILLLMVAVALLAQVVQVGWLVTLKPLRPKLEKLNPVRGAMNLVKLRNLMKLVFNTLKLAVVGTTAVLVVRSKTGAIATLPSLGMVQAVYKALLMGLELAAWLLALLIVMGAIDFIYQKWQHTRDLRMTKHEVQEERRSMDGDPHVKKRRFKMAMEIAMQRIGHSVPKADVVVTNPTHFAVALRYDQSTMRAPRVVAKGADLLAMRIRTVATGAGVPIVERPVLARALYWGVDVGREVSPEQYEAVAEVLAFVYRLEGRAA